MWPYLLGSTEAGEGDGRGMGKEKDRHGRGHESRVFTTGCGSILDEMAPGDNDDGTPGSTAESEELQFHSPQLPHGVSADHPIAVGAKVDVLVGRHHPVSLRPALSCHTSA